MSLLTSLATVFEKLADERAATPVAAAPPPVAAEPAPKLAAPVSTLGGLDDDEPEVPRTTNPVDAALADWDSRLLNRP